MSALTGILHNYAARLTVGKLMGWLEYCGTGYEGLLGGMWYQLICGIGWHVVLAVWPWYCGISWYLVLPGMRYYVALQYLLVFLYWLC